MSEFIEINKKDLKMQNDTSQTIDKYNKESFSTRSEIVQNALIQSKVSKQTVILWEKQFRYGQRKRIKS